MKVPPMTLPTGAGGAPSLPPLPAGLPFSPELLWRYPNPYMPQPPPSPMESQLKAHLPGGLGHDPRIWNRDDVAVFMRYCEREFDLDKIDMDKFQMNGKAHIHVFDSPTTDLHSLSEVRGRFYDVCLNNAS